MGSGQPGLAAVTDTGPLIHLAEIGCLGLLSLFDPLHVAEAVWREAERPPVIRQQLIAARRHTLESAAVADFAAAREWERLQLADQESLYLAHELGVTILLTDDLAVRRAAQKEGLIAVGSLGVIVRASVASRIGRDAAEQHLADLHRTSSLFVTRAIVDLAIDQLSRELRGSTPNGGQ